MIRAVRFQSCLAFVFLISTAGVSFGQGYPPPMMGAGFGGACPPGGGCPPAAACGPAYTVSAPNVMNYRVNRHADLGNEQPIEAWIKQATQRSWLRLEYMNWDVEKPGRILLGAPVVGFDPNIAVVDPFQTDPTINVGFVQIPSLRTLTLNDAHGVRGTYGMWFNGGALELSFYGSEQTSDLLNIPDIKGDRVLPDDGDPTTIEPHPREGTREHPNIIIPLLNNGAINEPPDVGNPPDIGFLLFDQSYRASIDSQFWGTELNVLTRETPGSGAMKFQWLGGFRYFNFQERLTQVGVFNDGLEIPDQVTTLRTSSQNNMYGPQAGFRFQLASKWLTLSATPRIAFALNDYTNDTSFHHVAVDPDDASVTTTTQRSDLEKIDFTTVTQVSFKAEVHLNESFTLFGGYDFLWSYRVSRPFGGVDYDSMRGVDGLTPNIGSATDPESLELQGFSFGGVFRF